MHLLCIIYVLSFLPIECKLKRKMNRGIKMVYSRLSCFEIRRSGVCDHLVVQET